jgi:hypothetical protein
MARLLPLWTAVPVVLAVGVAEGLWENRWGGSLALEQAVARLDGVPRTVGDWQVSQEGDEELDPPQVARAEIAGYRWRHYVHPWTKARLGVLIVCGRPEPISMHTPDLCLPDGDYRMVAPPVSQTIDVPGLSRPAEFMTARFRRSAFAATEQLNFFWSWSAGGEWVTPNYPRLAFGRESVLYRIYVICPADGPGRWEKEGRLFMEAFLPALNRCLFPGSPEG